MATIYTHAVVGLGLARLCAVRPKPWAYWGLAAVLPIIPDFDVVSTATYGGLLAHRGITHSLLFALVFSIVAASMAFRYFAVRWWWLVAVLFAIIASHGLLDAMNSSGAGIPFFWPLGSRYGNWGPIPISDIAFDLPDPRYSRAVRAELVWVCLPMTLVVSLAMLYRRLTRREFSGRSAP